MGALWCPPSLQSPCASSCQHQNLQASLSEANPESTCRSDSSAPGTAPGTRWISVCKVPRKERNGNCTLVGIISQFINASDQQAASLRLVRCWVIHSTEKRGEIFADSARWYHLLHGLLTGPLNSCLAPRPRAPRLRLWPNQPLP